MQNTPTSPQQPSKHEDEEDFSFYMNSNENSISIKSPQMSEISNNNEKSVFLTATPYITVFDESSNKKKMKNISEKSPVSNLFKNYFEIKPDLSQTVSDLNKGFIENCDDSIEDDDKFNIFKKNFEGLLVKCEYFDNDDIKKKIDLFLKNINKNQSFSFKNKENYIDETDENEISQKTQIFLKSNKKFQMDCIKNGDFLTI